MNSSVASFSNLWSGCSLKGFHRGGAGPNVTFDPLMQSLHIDACKRVRATPGWRCAATVPAYNPNVAVLVLLCQHVQLHPDVSVRALLLVAQ